MLTGGVSGRYRRGAASFSVWIKDGLSFVYHQLAAEASTLQMQYVYPEQSEEGFPHLPFLTTIKVGKPESLLSGYSQTKRCVCVCEFFFFFFGGEG